ncbi:unnamed protein product [Spodoptera littoralis]|uniref:Ig-like domain-containing protein n=1 Tax=Spodoptera littoralis TaxID=7109 RepID=A0A9P0N5I1_SPOLI|nr:unnamed protein product [Spodoptera littoralis]CAH1642259.1 unnamed protein product [Spodoptera littoralis]
MNDKVVAIIDSSAVRLNKYILSCGFDGTNENMKNVFARMTFESDIAHDTVRVIGLNRPNIMYEYLSGNVWTTVYQYSVGETLRLGCVLNTWPPRNYILIWTFHGTESTTRHRDNYWKMKYSVENFTTTLTENDDKKVIECMAYQNLNVLKNAEVKLQLKDISNSENLEADTNTYTSDNLFIIFVCIFGILLITIVGIVYWCKRLRRPKTTEAPCDNLRDENEMTPIPESTYDSCFSKNFSDIQANNEFPQSSENSEPCNHKYEEVNYSQCKPKSGESQQRSSTIYNEPYDHFRIYRKEK